MCEECVGLEWEARALHKAVADGSSSWGVQPSGVDGCCSGEALPKVVGELWGCGCPTGELPMPAGSGGPSLCHPWDSQGQPEWGRCPAQVSEADR